MSEEIHRSTRFASKMIVAYLLTAAAYVFLAVPVTQKMQILLGFPAAMILFSLGYVYFRRVVSWSEFVLEEIWDDTTDRNRGSPQHHPSKETTHKIARKAAEKRSEDLSRNYQRLSSGISWVLICLLLHYFMLLSLTGAIALNWFPDLVSSYEQGEWALTGVLAIVNPLIAVAVFTLKNVSGGPESAVITLLSIGLPALLATPGMPNLVRSLEGYYCIFVTRAEERLPHSTGRLGKLEPDRVSTGISLSLLIIHVFVFLIL